MTTRITTTAVAIQLLSVSLHAATVATSTGDEQAKLAMQLNNPVAALISVPLQSNWDFGIGPSDAYHYKLNVQPVVPISLNEDWNLISRTILPVIAAESPAPGIDGVSGLGDSTQSLFLSPQKPTGGIIWGAGPVILIPSATDDLLGPDQWGAGPTVVALTTFRDASFDILDEAAGLARSIWLVTDAPSGFTRLAAAREVGFTGIEPANAV